jgi:actin-related protein
MAESVNEFLAYPAMIFDQGSGTFKAGFAGEENPALIFSTS